jgi:CO/xanthine dehydrogenase FAD-binding subunit
MKAGYQKLRPRASIDFPMLSVAFAARVNGASCESARLVVSAIAARPALIRRLEDLHGQRADVRFAEELGRRAQKQVKPLTNIGVDPGWRREILPVLVRRTVLRAIQ